MIAAGFILLGAILLLLPVGNAAEMNLAGAAVLIVGAVLAARDQLRR